MTDVLAIKKMLEDKMTAFAHLYRKMQKRTSCANYVFSFLLSPENMRLLLNKKRPYQSLFNHASRLLSSLNNVSIQYIHNNLHHLLNFLEFACTDKPGLDDIAAIISARSICNLLPLVLPRRICWGVNAVQKLDTNHTRIASAIKRELVARLINSNLTDLLNKDMHIEDVLSR